MKLAVNLIYFAIMSSNPTRPLLFNNGFYFLMSYHIYFFIACCKKKISKYRKIIIKRERKRKWCDIKIFKQFIKIILFLSFEKKKILFIIILIFFFFKKQLPKSYFLFLEFGGENKSINKQHYFKKLQTWN